MKYVNESKTDAIAKPLCFIVLKLNYKGKVLMLYNIQVVIQSLIKTFWRKLRMRFRDGTQTYVL